MLAGWIFIGSKFMAVIVIYYAKVDDILCFNKKLKPFLKPLRFQNVCIREFIFVALLMVE